MRTQAFVAFILAAASFTASAQGEAPKPEQLERVVVSGKAVRSELVQLPRVVVTGLSVNSQMQQLLLASAKPALRRI
ncbi:hypothetical protein LNV09_04890 [Paucibacter sp. B2R-40]|uniref:hypothetical protein n=1 Tax=Paucibacter sp. B2R-40 TaxID=2893554 RepID=UPI0021E39B1E|nr:hypothetical protein [Paucibacter sp. B2R-40]MCV2353493.1 hypothetical protein [Paucibacter sp. B2R-40]